MLGDNWDSDRDEDWIGVDLEQGIYTVPAQDEEQPAREAACHGPEGQGGSENVEAEGQISG